MNPRRVVVGLLRLGLGGVLVVAGVLKLSDPSRFAIEIGNYQMWPGLAPALAAVLPAVEIVAGGGLLVLPWVWRRAAGLLAVILMLMFTVAVSFTHLRGINIDCGCFGGQGGPINAWTVVRNLTLLCGAGLLMWLDSQPVPSRKVS